MEPHHLRRWRMSSGKLLTCGRPGRSKWKSAARVPQDAINAWVTNLPEGELIILSLLGEKPDGTSEYSFYPFRGSYEQGEKPTFKEWLREHYPGRVSEVREYPTTDFQSVPGETLERVAADITQTTQSGKTVVLIDSGGETRTGAVCRFLGLKEQFG